MTLVSCHPHRQGSLHGTRCNPKQAKGRWTFRYTPARGRPQALGVRPSFALRLALATKWSGVRDQEQRTGMAQHTFQSALESFGIERRQTLVQHDEISVLKQSPHEVETAPLTMR